MVFHSGMNMMGEVVLVGDADFRQPGKRHLRAIAEVGAVNPPHHPPFPAATPPPPASLPLIVLFCFVPSQGGNMHVYKATPKEYLGGKGKLPPCRYFARAASEAVGRGKRYFMEQARIVWYRKF